MTHYKYSTIVNEIFKSRDMLTDKGISLGSKLSSGDLDLLNRTNTAIGYFHSNLHRFNSEERDGMKIMTDLYLKDQVGFYNK